MLTCFLKATNPMAKPNNKDKGNLPSFHPHNPHQGRYKLGLLSKTTPELKRYLIHTPAGAQSIDFSNEKAVLCLNKALLAHYYQIKQWSIPAGYLCPPIPGRADYIHHIADLLAKTSTGKVPRGNKVRILDIGTGANCIYPIIGSQSYGWHFVATDIDPVAIKSVEKIIRLNTCLQSLVTPMLQKNSDTMFKNIIKEGDRFDLTLCNPPFHSSEAEALSANQQKSRNLSKGKHKQSPAKLNFGGKKNELWCRGGEIRFLKNMINESKLYAQQVTWFSSLVSKGDNILPLNKLLKQRGATKIEVISMGQGQKISRCIAWSFVTN